MKMVASGTSGHSAAAGGGGSSSSPSFSSLSGGAGIKRMLVRSASAVPRHSDSRSPVGGSNFGRNVRITVCTNQGGRKYMEDRVHIHCQRTANGQLDYIYFAVYDGHGGAEASVYAKQHLLNNILEHKGFQEGSDQGMQEAIQEGFLQTHSSMKRVVDKWPRTASGFTSTSGTTASVAFVRNGKLYSGHVGDSGIVLGIRELNTDDSIRGKQITIDHKPDSPDELKRIEDSGGQVMCKAGVMRVVWTRPVRGHVGPVRRSTPQEKIPFLAVARALGDLWSYNDQSDQYVVSPDPDMDVVKLTPKQTCMVLGSDGLWNVIKSQYCVDIVNAHEWKELKEEGRLEDNLKILNRPCHSNHSRWLVRHALRGWGTLRADNISVITVIFDPPDARLDESSPCVLQSDPNLDIEKVLTDTPDAMIRITPFTTLVLKTSPVELVYSGAVDLPLGQPTLFSRINGVSLNTVAFSGPGFSSYSKEAGLGSDDGLKKRRQSLASSDSKSTAAGPSRLKLRNSIAGSFSRDSDSSDLENDSSEKGEKGKSRSPSTGNAKEGLKSRKRTFYCTKHGLTCEKVRRLNQAAEDSPEKLQELLAKNKVKKDSPATFTPPGNKPKYFCRKHGLSCAKVKKMNDEYFKQKADMDALDTSANSFAETIRKTPSVRASIKPKRKYSLRKRNAAHAASSSSGSGSGGPSAPAKRRSHPLSTPFPHNTRQYSRVTRAGTHLSPTRSLPSKLRSSRVTNVSKTDRKLNSSFESSKGKTTSKRKLFDPKNSGELKMRTCMKVGDSALSETGPAPKRGKFWNSLLSTVFRGPSYIKN